MEQNMTQFEKLKEERRKTRRKKNRIVVTLAAVVVLCTFSALILPAITLNSTPVCGQQEHTHGNECYTEKNILVCTTPEHTHTEDCWIEEKVLTCGLEETPGHIHDDSCYQEVRELVCDLEEDENHTHDESCYATRLELICELEECEGHTHDESCYEMQRTFSCGLEKHTHEDNCYEVVRELTCQIPEHTHTDACYQPSYMPSDPPETEESDPNADLENEEIWKASLSGVTLTGIWSEDVLSVAQSQLNYKESSRNYVIGSDGSRKGYTRYGAWYGSPYGDWCAMFVSFCLNYAGVNDFPLEASPFRWIQLLQDESVNAWREADTYIPAPGDLVFFDLNLDGKSDHVGIVTGINGAASSAAKSTVSTIEGNYSNAVKEASYSVGDKRITGYGVLPENPGEQITSDDLRAPGDYYVWFDGTEGLGTDLNYYQGATNTEVLAVSGRVTLPTTSGTPANGFVLNGWYDINTGTYYGKDQLGTEITVGQNTVFYADWVPASDDYLDSGRTTVQSADTAGFVQTELFDYNELVNMLSASVSGSVSQYSHSETWSLDSSKPFNFTFYQWAYNSIQNNSNRSIGALANLNERNQYGGTANDRRVIQGIVTSENDDIIQTLFTDSGTPGVRKVGEGPGLFQYNASTGYYYYDSNLNGAAYQASEGRFYVYSDVTRIRNQSKNGNAWSNTNNYTNAFMPLNTESIVPERSGEGNFWFGMKTTIDFFLPEAPGTNNGNCNYSATGDPMVFRFSGDDDVWVFVDGVLVLDLGGIHGVVDGTIDFSKGTVTYTDYYGRTQTKSLPDSIQQGEHKLTMYYLERGSSASNCSIYFNIAPRYGLELTKKDRENQHLLNGAEFSVYMDENCTIPAQLWENKVAFDTGEPSDNTFTVVNGVLNCWGLSPGRTYYIKETKPPENGYADSSDTTIILTLDSRGEPSVQVMNPSDYLGVTDVSRDSEIQKVSMTVDNLKPPNTTIKAEKIWLDTDGEITNEGVPIQLQLYYSKFHVDVPPTQTHLVTVTTQYFSSDGQGGSNSDNDPIIPADYSYSLEVQNGSDLTITLNSLTNSAGFYSVTANGAVITPESVVYGTENCYIGGQWGQHPIASAEYKLTEIAENQTVVITLIGWPEWENGRVVMAKTMSASYAETTHAVETPEPIEIPEELPEDAVPYGDPVTVYPDENGNWYYEWTDLPRADGEEAYYYYVQELPLEGYETSYSGNGTQEGTIVITNREIDDGLIRLRLLKTSSESGNPLSGASFDLYRDAGPDEQGVSLAGLEGSFVKVNGSPIITGQDGRATIGGLEEGVYYLVETEAPTGFVVDPTPHRIEVGAHSAHTEPEDSLIIGSETSSSVTVKDVPKEVEGDLIVEKRWYEALADGSGRVPTNPRAEEIYYQIHRSYETPPEGVPFYIICKDLNEPDGVTVLQGSVSPGTSFRFYSYGVMNNGNPGWGRPSYTCEGGTVALTSVTEPIPGSSSTAQVYEVTVPLTSEEVIVTLDWTQGFFQSRFASYQSGYPDGYAPVPPTGSGETVEEVVTVVVDGVETNTFTLNEANDWIQSFERSELNETPDTEYVYWVEELDPEEDWTVDYHTEYSSEFPDRLYLMIENTVEAPEPPPDAPDLHKSIDFLGDGAENPDTDLSGTDYYRLYLSAVVEEWTEDYYLSELVDELSPYIRYYSEQPDVKVVWTDENNIRHVIWENGVSTDENSDAAGNAIIQAVTYDASQSEASSGRVRIVFNPECAVSGSNSFELSFNVAVSNLAANEYAEEGYNAVGDPDTDFEQNTTSSGQEGFHSNHRAWMEWVGNGMPYETEYDHPVVQVSTPRVQICKVSAVDGSVLSNAYFDLYKDCASDTEGAVLIPGIASCFGLKWNESPLITNAFGRLDVMELEPGTYYLVETAAPEGFYASSKPIAFSITNDGIAVSSEGMFAGFATIGDSLEDGTFVLIVENKASFFLPETGGYGPEWYIFGGFVLIKIALMCSITILSGRRKRRNGHSLETSQQEQF